MRNSNQSAFSRMSIVLETLKASVLDKYVSNVWSFENITGLGFSIDDILVSCTFDEKRCDKVDFSQTYSFDYGNCFTFNSADNIDRQIKREVLTGLDYALKLELFAGLDCKLIRGKYL